MAKKQSKKRKVEPTGFSLSNVKLKDSAKIDKEVVIKGEDYPWGIEPDKCCKEDFEEALKEKKDTGNNLIIAIIVILSIALSLLTFSCSKDDIPKDCDTHVERKFIEQDDYTYNSGITRSYYFFIVNGDDWEVDSYDYHRKDVGDCADDVALR